MEYAATIWDSFLMKEINNLEVIQRRAARWTKSNYSYEISVTELLKDLNWAQLTDRRRVMRLTLFY